MDSLDLQHSDAVDLEITSDTSDDEEIPLTAAQVIQIMEEAWQNEKFAPEILPHKSEIVDCLFGQITYMENNLQNLDNDDFKKILHQMEVDRLRFVVTSYLRTRLEKIEMYVYSILKAEEERLERKEPSYLTDQELCFAKEFKQSLDQHFEGVLDFLPGFVPEDWKKEIISPNINSFVFAKVKGDVNGVILDSENNDDEEGFLDVKTGNQLVLSYKTISPLIKDGQACLI